MNHQNSRVGQLDQGKIHLKELVLTVPAPLVKRLGVRKDDQVIIASHGDRTVLTFYRHQLAPCVLIVDAHHALIEARGLDGDPIPPSLWHVEPNKELQ